MPVSRELFKGAGLHVEGTRAAASAAAAGCREQPVLLEWAGLHVGEGAWAADVWERAQLWYDASDAVVYARQEWTGYVETEVQSASACARES